MSLFKVSRYWNKVAFFVIELGQKMIWDYTGKNADILGDNHCSEYTKEIMTFTK